MPPMWFGENLHLMKNLIRFLLDFWNHVRADHYAGDGSAILRTICAIFLNYVVFLCFQVYERMVSSR